MLMQQSMISQSIQLFQNGLEGKNADGTEKQQEKKMSMQKNNCL